MKKHRPILLIIIIVVLSISTFGQQEQAENPQSTPENPTSQTEATVDETQALGSDTFVYLPRGRRDPFWDLLGNMKTGKDGKGRELIPGIAGLLIDELELEGIIFIKGKYHAAMRGPDSRPYLVTVGETVYDGVVVKIDSQSVIFKKNLTIAIGGVKEKLIPKLLNPEEEQEK